MSRQMEMCQIMKSCTLQLHTHAITRVALGKQVFLIQRVVSTVFYPISDEDSDMIFHGWN